MTKFLSHRLHLTANNRRKRNRGEPTVLNHDQLEGGEIEVHMLSNKHRKMMTALRKGKGIKLQLSPAEMEHTIEHGAGAKQFFQNLGKELKPYVRPALTSAIKAGAPALVTALGAPELAPIAGAVANQFATPLANTIASSIGAGTKKPRKKKGKGVEIKHLTEPCYPEKVPHHLSGHDRIHDMPTHGKGVHLQNNWAPFLNSKHPAQTPALPPHDQSWGGSFSVAGTGVHPSVLRGTPMNPRIPYPDQSVRR